MLDASVDNGAPEYGVGIDRQPVEVIAARRLGHDVVDSKARTLEQLCHFSADGGMAGDEESRRQRSVCTKIALDDERPVVRSTSEKPDVGGAGFGQPSEASSTVSSAAGSASRRSSGMGWPLRMERP